MALPEKGSSSKNHSDHGSRNEDTKPLWVNQLKIFLFVCRPIKRLWLSRGEDRRRKKNQSDGVSQSELR